MSNGARTSRGIHFSMIALAWLDVVISSCAQELVDHSHIPAFATHMYYHRNRFSYQHIPRKGHSPGSEKSYQFLENRMPVCDYLQRSHSILDGLPSIAGPNMSIGILKLR